MKTISQIQLESYKLYKSLETGRFFDSYHDLMLDLLEQTSYLEQDVDGDVELGLEILEQCKAIVKAQQVLIKAKIK
jgi:hypothetical protein